MKQLYIKYLFLFFYINLPTFIDEEPNINTNNIAPNIQGRTRNVELNNIFRSILKIDPTIIAPKNTLINPEPINVETCSCKVSGIK